MAWIVFQRGMNIGKFATEAEAKDFAEGKKECVVKESISHAEYMKMHSSYVERVLDRNTRRMENVRPDED